MISTIKLLLKSEPSHPVVPISLGQHYMSKEEFDRVSLASTSLIAKTLIVLYEKSRAASILLIPNTSLQYWPMTANHDVILVALVV